MIELNKDSNGYDVFVKEFETEENKYASLIKKILLQTHRIH